MVHDLGMLASRAAVGLAMAAHGAQKTHGMFEGPGPEGAEQMLSNLGFQSADRMAKVASYNELVSGLLVALGLGGPLGPAGIMSGMLAAGMTVHAKNGFFNSKSGVELNVLYSAAALAFASAGFGALSLDRAFGLDRKLRNPLFTTLVVGGAVAGAMFALSQRQQQAAKT